MKSLTFTIPEIKFNIVRENGGAKWDARKTLTNPETAAQVAREILEQLDDGQERVIAIYMDNKLKLIGYRVIGLGSLTQCAASPADIYRGALLVNAAAVAIAHNHPSGDARPSAADIEVTQRALDAGAVIGISLTDHIVIGDGTGEYTSIRETGKIDWIN